LVRSVLVLVLLLGGCAKVTEMHGAEGGLLYLIGCYGALTPMSACYKKAAELCPAGYTIIDQTSAVTHYRTSQGTVDNLDRQLAIRCDSPDSPAQSQG
jgi:hypothetical protein